MVKRPFWYVIYEQFKSNGRYWNLVGRKLGRVKTTTSLTRSFSAISSHSNSDLPGRELRVSAIFFSPWLLVFTPHYTYIYYRIWTILSGCSTYRNCPFLVSPAIAHHLFVLNYREILLFAIIWWNSSIKFT